MAHTVMVISHQCCDKSFHNFKSLWIDLSPAAGNHLSEAIHQDSLPAILEPFENWVPPFLPSCVAPVLDDIFSGKERKKTGKQSGDNGFRIQGCRNMNEELIGGLAKTIANLAIFLEFSDGSLLNDDAAVEAIEQLADDLQSMSGSAQGQFAETIRLIASDYDQDMQQYLKEFPETFGLACA